MIRIKRIESQHELLHELSRIGIDANQASVSRDLNELGISKVQGVYALPQLKAGESALTDFLDIESAGEHLLVVKTDIGKAQAVALAIDRLKISEIVGTLAGDDTIFVATKTQARQPHGSMRHLTKRRRAFNGNTFTIAQIYVIRAHDQIPRWNHWWRSTVPHASAGSVQNGTFAEDLCTKFG